MIYYEQQSIENDDLSHFTCHVVNGQENRKGRQRYVVPGEKLKNSFPSQAIFIISRPNRSNINISASIYPPFK
jgi:hypothetical protein